MNLHHRILTSPFATQSDVVIPPFLIPDIMVPTERKYAMSTTVRVPCPRHSPKTPVLFSITTEHTRQGKLNVITCVICGFNESRVVQPNETIHAIQSDLRGFNSVELTQVRPLERTPSRLSPLQDGGDL